MKAEEIIKSIAEACGWQYQPEDNCVVWQDDECQHETNPLNDLNAMHEAAMWLRSSQPLAYVHYTAEITRMVTKFNSDLEDKYSISAHDATAAQRAEAFLRTIGKWVE